MSADVNDHEIWRERAALYALGALTGDERVSFETHLQTCLECGAELLTLRPAVDALAQAVPQVDPRPELRDRVMAAAFSESRPQATSVTPQTATPATQQARVVVERPAPTRWLALAAMLLVTIGLAAYATTMRSRVARLEEQLEAALAQSSALQARVTKAERTLAGTQTQLDSAQTQLAVVTAPDSTRVTLAGQKDTPTASGRADWSPSRGLAISVANLPPLLAMRDYQVWLLTGGAPVSVGLLPRDAVDGRTVVLKAPPGAPLPTGVALSEEPEGGVAQPGNRIYLVGQIARR
jgi:anti-sigma-K factor RskA